jgi:hypothetical protein
MGDLVPHGVRIVGCSFLGVVDVDFVVVFVEVDAFVTWVFGCV